ncbi:hypothetical protein MOQ67_09520 [Pseudomonas sp. LY-1]|uniref:Uncharacterized protein n=1 Tax=Pseudomonas veronii TaxID=76761 RepID=A0ABS0VIE9_PSEVE|nr:hypothetical protein [Pseudomonas veronii]MBI6552135.1 hypothetical protein [Pseudomonas veronii]MBI6651301.1 hypothetical protein [Pseudomonas veronii]
MIAPNTLTAKKDGAMQIPTANRQKYHGLEKPLEKKAIILITSEIQQ